MIACDSWSHTGDAMKESLSDSLRKSISTSTFVHKEQNKRTHLQSYFIVCILISNTNATVKQTLRLDRRNELISMPCTQYHNITTIIGYVFDLKLREVSGFNNTVIVFNNEYQLKHLGLKNKCDFDYDVLQSPTNNIMNTIDDTNVPQFNPLQQVSTSIASHEFDDLACDLRAVSPAPATATIVTIDKRNEMKYEGIF